MIISKDYQAIREYITTVMDRGVTKLPIRGGYTTSDKIMLMAIVSSHELPTLQEKSSKLTTQPLLLSCQQLKLWEEDLV